MPSTNFCSLGASGPRNTGVYVELLVNGAVVQGQQLYHEHDVTLPTAITLTGSTRLFLNENDIVTVRVRSVGLRRRIYQTLPTGCTLVVKRERLFE